MSIAPSIGYRLLKRSMCKGKGKEGGKGERKRRKGKEKGKRKKGKGKEKGERERDRERRRGRRKEKGKGKGKGERRKEKGKGNAPQYGFTMGCAIFRKNMLWRLRSTDSIKYTVISVLCFCHGVTHARLVFLSLETPGK